MDIAAIRCLVVEAIRELGLAVTAPNWETILVADGCLRGYRFEFDAVRAFWFVQSKTVELYTPEWSQLRIIELERSPAGKAM